MAKRAWLKFVASVTRMMLLWVLLVMACDCVTLPLGKPVTGDTLFQMASISKWVAAWGVMTLAEAGKVDLDTPVSRYLKRWALPPASLRNRRTPLPVRTFHAILCQLLRPFPCEKFSSTQWH